MWALFETLILGVYVGGKLLSEKDVKKRASEYGEEFKFISSNWKDINVEKECLRYLKDSRKRREMINTCEHDLKYIFGDEYESMYEQSCDYNNVKNLFWGTSEKLGIWNILLHVYISKIGKIPKINGYASPEQEVDLRQFKIHASITSQQLRTRLYHILEKNMQTYYKTEDISLRLKNPEYIYGEYAWYYRDDRIL